MLILALLCLAAELLLNGLEPAGTYSYIGYCEIRGGLLYYAAVMCLCKDDVARQSLSDRLFEYSI